MFMGELWFHRYNINNNYGTIYKRSDNNIINISFCPRTKNIKVRSFTDTKWVFIAGFELGLIHNVLEN